MEQTGYGPGQERASTCQESENWSQWLEGRVHETHAGGEAGEIDQPYECRKVSLFIKGAVRSHTRALGKKVVWSDGSGHKWLTPGVEWDH